MAITIVLKMLRNWYSKYWTWLLRKSRQGLLKKEGYACILEDLILKIFFHPSQPCPILFSGQCLKGPRESVVWVVEWDLRHLLSTEKKGRTRHGGYMQQVSLRSCDLWWEIPFPVSRRQETGDRSTQSQLPITLYLSCASSGHKPNRNPEDRNPEDRTGN